jgi:hypothetical protein
VQCFLRKSLWPVTLVFFLAILIAPLPAQTAAPARLQPWLRSASQTADGFYFQPEIIGEDYPTATAAQVENDIAIARRVGARALRFGVSWLETEPRPEKYDWSKLDIIIDTAYRQGMPVLPYICYVPRWASTGPQQKNFWALPPRESEWFARFVGAAAARYKGKVLAWGLWNEPDNVYWKGRPHELGVMIWAAATAIHKADPAAGVWMGGLAEGADDFFQRIVAGDRVDLAVNAIGLHGYPETWDARASEQFYPQQLDGMRHMLASVHDPVDLWADENGYGDYAYSKESASRYVQVPIAYAYEHTPAYQAVMLWRDHVEVLASGTASLMGWYRIHDLPPFTRVIGDANNRFLGLVDLHGREKPAFYALRFYDQTFNMPTRSLDGKAIVRPQGGSTDVVVHVIEKQNGEVVVTGWLARPDSAALSHHAPRPRDGRPPGMVQVQFPPGYHFSRIRSYRVTGELVSDRELAAEGSPFILRDFRVTGDSATIAVLSP